MNIVQQTFYINIFILILTFTSNNNLILREENKEEAVMSCLQDFNF